MSTYKVEKLEFWGGETRISSSFFLSIRSPFLYEWGILEV